jgi:SAM-dependent methyltransferase
MTNRTGIKQGSLWGERAKDWAEVQEPRSAALFEDVLRRLEIGSGTKVLDAGCASGVFSEMAAARGAVVTGFDASPALLAIARTRVPAASFAEGDLEELPYADGAFDVVIGNNSFQYAADPVAALREARRVLRRGGTLSIATWGRAEDCEARTFLAALKGFLNPPPGAPGPFALSDAALLRDLVANAGFTARSVHDVATTWRYCDLDEAMRGLLCAGPGVAAIRAGGEEAVRAAALESIAAYRQSDGGYRIENQFRYLVAT